MDWAEETPNLCGEIEVLNVRAIFNGRYSCVYKGRMRATQELVSRLLSIHEIPLMRRYDVGCYQGLEFHSWNRRINNETGKKSQQFCTGFS